MREQYQFSLDSVQVPHLETKHRRIVTAIPSPGTRELMERIARVESSNAMDQLPVVWDKAKGYQIFDPWGNCWIDFTSTIFVTNSGHAHPHMVESLTKGLDKLLHSYSYPTENRACYVEKLIQFTPPNLQKASLLSTGTEASERAIKLARLYGMKSNPMRKVIVGWDDNFHGKTMGAQMAGGLHEQKAWIGYHDPNMVHLPFPYPWVIEKTDLSGAELFQHHLKGLEGKGIRLEEIVAFIVESFQGWGAIFYPADYIQAMRRWADEQDVLLMFDEIQAGFGRTGRLFAYEHYCVNADVVICGKGISGSIPLSAVLGRADVIDLDPAYTSTHGGHPLACTAGLANIEIFERENLVEESKRKEPLMRAELERWKRRFPDRIGRILGKGMIWGIFITKPNGGDELDPVFCDRIIERALQKGVFNIRTGLGTIKIGPPLNVPDDALIEGLRVIEESISELVTAG
ncbi:aminotransferase class III-fold pyridoxal phosphate-dependent enzyme [Nitrospiraceae bacterium AH_259_D15_M11_P09]|nr:aminotransferase class III-fold pyridoxal phosphate-dependent enzyme [Nitrospiraceae bacterium AH_259_D15_M11_P09]